MTNKEDTKILKNKKVKLIVLLILLLILFTGYKFAFFNYETSIFYSQSASIISFTYVSKFYHFSLSP